jgi:hypothetical protein
MKYYEEWRIWKMDVHEFLKRFMGLTDDNKTSMMAEIFGMMKSLDRKDLLIRTLEEYEEKQA